MSEEKLYAVKNNEGKYWNFEDQDGFWKLSTVLLAAFTDEESAKSLAHDHGGHVVSLIEEPEKVVLTKEQAEIVEEAYDSNYPASYIAGSSDDEKLIMKAYVNGYTVANEKKYLLPMDGTLEENDDNDNFQLYAYCYRGRWLIDEAETDPSYKHRTVTKKELDTAPEWVKAITPVEVTDDAEES